MILSYFIFISSSDLVAFLFHLIIFLTHLVNDLVISLSYLVLFFYRFNHCLSHDLILSSQYFIFCHFIILSFLSSPYLVNIISYLIVFFILCCHLSLLSDYLWFFIISCYLIISSFKNYQKLTLKSIFRVDQSFDNDLAHEEFKLSLIE